MDEQRLIAYIQLIEAILNCPSGEEMNILQANPELVDAVLVQVMRAVADKEPGFGVNLASLAEFQLRNPVSEGNARWLWNFAQEIETANYELPRLEKKLTADALLWQGSQQYLHSEYPQAWESLQQSLALYEAIGDKAKIALCWEVLGDLQRDRGNWDEAERLYQQSLAVQTELGDRAGMGYVYNALAFVHQHSNKIPQAFAAWREGLAACPPERFPVEALLLGRNLGDAAFEIEDWPTAIEGYEAAITAVETSCTFAPSYQKKQERRTAQIGVYEKLVQACINSGDIGRALASVERSKSRNLVELLANRDIYPKGDIPPEILTQLDTLRREVTAKQQLLETLESPLDKGAGGFSPGQRGSSRMI